MEKEFTHIIVTKEDGEKLLAYLLTKQASEVINLIDVLRNAQGVTVTVNEKKSDENQNQETTPERSNS